MAVSRDPMKEAERVDRLAEREPTTEQSARENAGNTRGTNDGTSDLGISDTPRGVPDDQRRAPHAHDPSNRTSVNNPDKIQGESGHLPEDDRAEGDRERQVEKNSL
jgi:hypothetical protein